VTLAVVVAAVLFVVILLAAWARFSGTRSEQQSVASYERALDILGDVSKRTGPSHAVRIIPPEEVARSHVRQTEHPDAEFPSAAIGSSDAPPPRIKLEPPVPPSRADHRRAPSREEILFRRVATGAAAVVAIALVAVVGWRLSDTRSSSPAAASKSHTHQTTPPASTTTIPQHTTTTVPTTIVPVSIVSSTVNYSVPAASYTIGFAVTGGAACWVGITGSAGTPYLYSQTLSPGESYNYAATGPVVVRLGAPSVMSMTLNGVAVEVPPGNGQLYDLAFTPTATSPA
jgi:hypothetical protein